MIEEINLRDLVLDKTKSKDKEFLAYVLLKLVFPQSANPSVREQAIDGETLNIELRINGELFKFSKIIEMLEANMYQEIQRKAEEIVKNKHSSIMETMSNIDEALQDIIRDNSMEEYLC